MKSDLAIASLIRSRMTELGLSRGELAKRLGYKNLPKGIRRMDVLCDGDVGETKQFLDVLPQALETSAETVKRALDQTVLDRLPEGVPAFGKPIGFVINYSPDKQSGSIQTGNRSQFWIRPSVPGPPFSALGASGHCRGVGAGFR